MALVESADLFGAQQTLKDCSASVATHADEVQDHQAEHDKRWCTVQRKAAFGRISGEFRDDVAKDGERKNQIQYEGHDVAPCRNARFVSHYIAPLSFYMADASTNSELHLILPTSGAIQ
jgi:hypothetical protein